MDENEAITALQELAFPYETRRFDEVFERGLKMAHYTTAENAALILKNRTLWLRNAQLMNDFSEVAYGTECVIHAMQMGVGAQLETALNNAHPGLWNAVADFINKVDWQARTQTYLTSLSAHDPDDMLGRLSMWRAYGGFTSGVALIFKTEVFANDAGQLNTYSSPVAYGNAAVMFSNLKEMADGLTANIDLVRSVPFQNAQAIVTNALQFATLSFKHPAFAEEQEWRVIHRPRTDASAFIPTSVETVRGIPQMICKVPLVNQPGLDMPWMSLDRLLHSIIVGPCVYPNQVAWAFSEILSSIGIDPTGKISIAAIPLRQQG